MSANQDPIVLMLAVLLIPGLWLLFTGLRGRRVGDEPRCRRCAYILHGIESERCPECGSSISLTNIVHGQRQRRWKSLMVGAILTLVGLTPLGLALITQMGQINWYQYRPTAWVISDLDTAASRAAEGELNRRIAAGELSNSAWQSLIEKGLQEQLPQVRSPRQGVLDFLGQAFRAGKLTDEQKDRLVENALIATLSARAIVAEGEQVPLSGAMSGRCPSNGGTIWTAVSAGQWTIDGKVIAKHRGGMTMSAGGGGAMGVAIASGAVGKHLAEETVAWSIYDGTFGDKGASKLIGTHELTVSATYEVRKPEDVPPIKLLDTPELQQLVGEAVRPDDWTQEPDGSLSGSIAISKPPCDVVFDVFSLTDAGESKLGWVSCSKGKESQLHVHGSTPFPRMEKVTVIIRGSAAAAKRTVDLWEIFGGEIVFPDVSVKQRK